MFYTQKLGEARFNNLRRHLLLLRLLKSSSKIIHLPKKHQFSSLLGFFCLPFLSFGLIRTCFSFFSFCSKNYMWFSLAHEIKNQPKILFNLNFTLTHNGTQPLQNTEDYYVEAKLGYLGQSLYLTFAKESQFWGF